MHGTFGKIMIAFTADFRLTASIHMQSRSLRNSKFWIQLGQIGIVSY